MVGLALGGLLVAGCPPFSARLVDSRQLGDGVVTGAIDAFDDPENGRRLERLANDPDVADAIHGLTRAATEGALEGLTEEELSQRLNDRAEALVRAISGALADEVRDDLGPAARETIGLAVSDAVRRLSAPGVRRNVSQIGADLASASTRAAFEAMGEGIDEELAGPVEQLLRTAVRSSVDEAVQAQGPLGDLAAHLAERAARGAGDGFGRAMAEGPLHEQLSRIGQNTRDGVKDALTVVSIVGAVLLTLAIMAWLWNRRRLQEVEHALRLVTGTIKSHQQDERTRALVKEIKQRGRRDHPGGAPLRAFLDRNETLRVQVENADSQE